MRVMAKLTTMTTRLSRKVSKRIKKGLKSQRVVAAAVIVVVAGIGTYLVISSHAAGPYASIEASTGTITSGATSVTDSNASNGSYVQFGAENTQPPPNGVTPVLVGRTLEAGNTGNRLLMRGVAVWGIQDNITSNNNVGNDEYNDRVTIANTIKAWGGNEIRLRVLACDYNNQTYMSNATELQEIQNWQTAAQNAGLYIGITWWDPSDCGSSISHGAWASNYSEAFPMMEAVIKQLGATNPWVFYEPFNEPNGISEAQWVTAMTATDNLFRAQGYKGILVMDTNQYSHQFDATDMQNLQANDAKQAGMNNTSQIIFAKHDYSNEFPNPSTFDTTDWENNSYGTGTWNLSEFPVWETEFGNYNVGSENLNWSSEAATAMAGYVNNGTLVGASAFVWNWVDPNTITYNSDQNGSTSDTTPTQWGGYVENNFLKAVN